MYIYSNLNLDLYRFKDWYLYIIEQKVKVYDKLIFKVFYLFLYNFFYLNVCMYENNERYI